MCKTVVLSFMLHIVYPTINWSACGCVADDHLPQRQFDNFQFVNFEEVRRRGGDNPDASFALHALMELPEQFYVIKELNLLNNDI
eukprot:m.22018 g.22018  ORF g.22018 m.22018 type:complete len:85 (-) comp8791_c0_seq1:155-409(-)